MLDQQACLQICCDISDTTNLVHIPHTKCVQKESTTAINISFCTLAPGGAAVGVVDCGHQLLADSL